jgi:hypothetical protein
VEDLEIPAELIPPPLLAPLEDDYDELLKAGDEKVAPAPDSSAVTATDTVSEHPAEIKLPKDQV